MLFIDLTNPCLELTHGRERINMDCGEWYSYVKKVTTAILPCYSILLKKYQEPKVIPNSKKV